MPMHRAAEIILRLREEPIVTPSTKRDNRSGYLAVGGAVIRRGLGQGT